MSQEVPEPAAQDPERLLGTPATSGDLTEQLKVAKAGPSKLTIGLGVAVLVAVAFVGGIFTNQAFGSSSNSASAAQNGQQRQFNRGTGVRPSGANGFPGAGQGRTGGNVGTIDHIDGNTIYLKARDGSTVKATVSDQTSIELTTKGALSDLKPGDQITVIGQSGQDGSIDARTVTRRLAQPTN